ncbi:amino acid adenylation domain-containing protein [Coleofasciculus sp.]|uniref:amino acid adenylation domain-containing protein n=1 Tax=Coleofasciculus sp. TaxID=3100458 RepID=UPI0039F9E289
MTNNNINNQIAQLSPAKRALLEQRLKQKAAQTTAETSIPRLCDRDSIPLSFSQTRMWFLDQLEPGNAAYNRPSNIHITGQLNVTVLEQSLNEIIRRHDVLRTKFTEVDGQLTQVIIPTLTLSLPIIDLSDLPQNQQESEIQHLATQEAQKPFNLSQLPLIRATLLQKSQEDHILLMTFHHIIFDGWSMGVLIQELAAVYQAFSTGKPNSLPELPIQYADFAQWQRQRFQGEGLQSQLAYWKQQLGDELPVLELPTDRPRAAIQTFRGAKEVLILPRTLSDALKALSQQEGVTLFMTLLAAFQTLLYRYTGQEDVIVGTPIAGRDRTETEPLIGVFINTLVLRTQIQGTITFRELLSRVREMALAAYKNQDVPFEKLVEELQPERDLSHTPLFQVLFQLRNVPNKIVNLQDLRFIDCQFDRGIAAFDLTLDIIDKTEGLFCQFEYNTNLFNKTTIQRIANHFQVLLEGIINQPVQVISRLPILKEAERHQLLVEWNNTQTDYPKDKCIHQLFEEQVEKTPDAVAVVFNQQQLTYRELNHRANQLAHYLQQLGVKPESLVGICVERSLDMIVGLLGILKSGAAYVPLDPTYPTERLAYMLEDAQVGVLLTQDSLVKEIPLGNTQLIRLDSQWQIISQQSSENPVTVVTTNNLAYINYTSGSTGKPKGVEVLHRGVIRLLFGIDYVHLDGKQRLLQMAPISFDAATFEIWGALLHGSRCILFPETVPTAQTLRQVIQTHNITTVWLTSALFNSIVEQDVEALSGVQQLLTGGEALSVNPVKKALSTLPSTQLINGYGPTESTTFTCCYSLPQSLKDTELSIPIGRPINNTKVYLLDAYLQPVPIGVIGELYIGGDGLARGYLNRPELTIEKFITNPFSNQPNARLYKTGDLARYRADGNIEFMGRIDNQIKLRGFRIELGEIEAVLSQYPQVKDTVVIATEDQGGNKRLVAYCVSDSEQSITAELRSFLKTKLPDYMVPSSFVQLEALPLTPNGKVDRRALPAPEIEDILSTNFIPPRTATEEELAQIWTSVLRIKSIGIHDNFFELGGHSLLATQVISRIRQSWEMELPLRCLFESPTIAELSKHLETKVWSQASQVIQPVTREKKIPLSFAQQRLWFIDQFETESAVYNIPYALHLTGNLNRNALEQSLQTLIQRHETLRTRFQLVNEAPVQIIDPHIHFTLSIIDLDNQQIDPQSAQVQQRIQQEAKTPFNLTQAPLFRVKLLRLNPQSHILLLTLHHIISDGWSMGILIRELSSLYQAFCTGKPNPLAPLPIQYADFAIWQRDWLTGEVLDNQLSYWQKQLQGSPALLELPTNYPRPSQQTFRGTRQRFQLNLELTQQLKSLSQKAEATLFMTLLAGFATLLYRYSSQSDIVIGSPIANRNRREIESLIGFFVNALALRINLEGNPSFKELLAQVKQVALEGYAHQDLPFEKLVEAIQPERSLSYSPIFQVVFVLQNAPLGNLELPEITLTRLEIETETAKFDLLLSMQETEQGLTGVWEYNQDLFAGETITRMSEQFQTLLAGIVAHPEQSVSQLPILTEAQRHQLLVEWNNTQTDYPRDKCIHQLFEAQVERTPDAVAVVFEQEHLTYRELNYRANQLAHYLQTLGVQPEDLVGICVERSLDMIVGLLAILKAGGAYVPIDPTYPTERITYMLEDAQVQLLLTQESLTQELPVNHTQLICLDSQWQIISQQSPDNLLTGVTSENLAYINYTSGSTGKPKGVEVLHRGVIRLLFGIDYVHLDGKQRLLQMAPISFDAATFEIWGALLHGGQCILFPETVPTAQTLKQVIHTHNITTLWLTSALFNAIVAEDAEALSGVQQLLTGGEALSVNPVKKALAALPSTQIINGYGPTENTTFTCCYCLPKQLPETELSISIGRPISNTQVYLLDAYWQPVPIGVIGELYIGGDGLARGYLNRPELTGEKFISNPFSNQPHARLYKTGDLARYRVDGTIEFIGRVDNQIKLRGFRIELGEIEAVLNQYPQVKDTVVIATEDQPGNKRLIAYFVSDSEQSITAELRSFLKTKLPDYMMPSAFVQLDTLPLTANGKVDRRALPKPEQTRLELTETFVSPRDDLEIKLTQIWQNVLGVQPISIRDNFFELGGHSLLAVQLVNQIKKIIGTDIPLVTLFQLATIEEIANSLRSQKDISAKSSIVPIQPHGLKPPLFFANSPSAARKLSTYFGNEQPIYGLSIFGLEDIDEQKLSSLRIQDIAKQFVRDMRQIKPQGPYLIAAYCADSTIAFEMAQQILAQGQKVALLAFIDTIWQSPKLEFYFYWYNFRQFGFDYLFKKIQGNINYNRKKIINKYREIQSKFKLKSNVLNVDLPIQVQHRKLIDAFYTAHWNYVPQVYPGKITLFLCSELWVKQSPGLEKMAGGGLEIHQVPGYHSFLFQDPYVQVLYEKLKACIDQAVTENY